MGDYMTASSTILVNDPCSTRNIGSNPCSFVTYEVLGWFLYSGNPNIAGQWNKSSRGVAATRVHSGWNLKTSSSGT